VKNKVAPPFKKADLNVLFDRGFDHGSDVVEAALLFQLVTRSGAFYTIGKEKVQGRENLAAFILGNEKVRKELEQEIQKRIKEMRM
jgi:recombination protein RecA